MHHVTEQLFNPHGRLGEPGPAPEEPVYEVMSGENIYDRVREGLLNLTFLHKSESCVREEGGYVFKKYLDD